MARSEQTERSIRIFGASVLLDEGFVTGDVLAEAGVIRLGGEGRAANAIAIDGRGLLLLPGIVDIHGDGFERLVLPRPGVPVALDVALPECDRQFSANGITTAYHSVTWSWEGGARGAEPASAMLEAMERLRPQLAVDTRYHLRHETFNLDAEEEIIAWLRERRIDCLAFNDHMAGTIKQRHRPDKLLTMRQRAGLSEEAFSAVIDRVYARADEVCASIARLAQMARDANVTMLSHDDMTPQMRQDFRSLGCTIAEFPVNVATAEAAAAAGDAIVFGAPNVMRGGSHTGCPTAAEMVARGLCTVLASDYYFPALPVAPFRLAAEGHCDLASAWRLVSSGPADALGLKDRGRIAEGLRADLALVQPAASGPPRVLATIAAGRLAHLSDGSRLA